MSSDTTRHANIIYVYFYNNSKMKKSIKKSSKKKKRTLQTFFFSVRFFFQKNLKSPVSADLDRFQGSFMAINHFGVCLEAEKSQKTFKNHLIFMIFPNFEKFSDFFFKTKTKKIIEIYCSELILMVNRFKTVVFMPKTALQILKLLKNR